MTRKLLAKDKLRLIKKAEAADRVADLCRQFGISRSLFYRICAQHRKGLASRRQSDSRQVLLKRQELILDLVRSHPGFSSQKISGKLPKDKNGKPVVGNHGVQNVLERLGLSTYRRRLEFARDQRHIPVKEKLSAADRLHIIRKVGKGAQVADICRQYGISRTIFYRLLKRYKNTLLESQAKTLKDGQLKEALRDRSPIPYHPWRLTPSEIVDKLLEFVAKSPELSAHKLVEVLPRVAGRPILSNKGVQNVLRRHHLSTYEQRLAYSRLSEKAWRPRWTLAKVPQIPLYIWRMLYAPFATIPKLGWLFTRGQLLLIGIFFLVFYFHKILVAIATSPTGTPVGTFFAAISLTFGIFFFFYSFKYYLTILMVLKLAQSGVAGQPETGNQKQETGITVILNPSILLRVKNLIARSFGLRPQAFGSEAQARRDDKGGRRINLLLVNLEKVKLDSQKPFVSIHVALYNERRVVERLIRACTSQEWIKSGVEPQKETNDLGVQPLKEREANYEVVIADDSTDETMEIAKEVLLSMDYSVARERYDEQMEIFRFGPPPDSPLPTVKIIHRFARSGFKGGALQKALENTDARAQYIMVLDADFVPYADTIEQFVKTFQVLSPIEPINADLTDSAKSAPNQSNQRSSRIAAVQGYQWHVLNKSQTWVTRGVRTEYAGSYVIERSGAEIYGGLKQIAGSVYMIKADVLRQFGWGTSITEDFQLTLKLYEAGYKVAFTPYIQAPAEAVSTIKRLIRQRMRWAEGASFNVKVMFLRMLASDKLTLAEKLEFAYLAPYYLQAAFLVIGTFSWFLSEAILGSRLPFWTAAFGWSLVFTNLLALPLMNIIGMFLEESEERDYLGILSFIALSYIVVPFQAYAAIKGFLEKEEGPWFRTPKTGIVTDVFGRSGFGKFFGNLLGDQKSAAVTANYSSNEVRSFGGEFSRSLSRENSRGSNNILSPEFASAFNRLRGDLSIKPRHQRWVGNLALGVVIAITVLMSILAPLIPIAPQVHAQSPEKLVTVENAMKGQGKPGQEEPEEITTPRAIHLPTATSENLEMIFHKEPRVRIKLGQKELEFETLEIQGIGKVNPKKSLIIGQSEVRYEEIVQDIDLVYKLGRLGFEEHFIIKKSKPVRSVIQRVILKEVNVVGPTITTFGLYDGENKEIFKLGNPFLQEEKSPQNKNGGIKMTLEKGIVGFALKKTLENEAINWLAAPERNFPVVLDPSVVVSGNIVNADVDFGGQQQKLVYVSGAYYAFHNDGGRIAYRKCSSNCNNGSANWSDGSDVNLNDGADTDNEGPNTFLDGTTIWVAWFDNSDDNIVFQSINTASSDAQGSSTCASGDLGNVAGGDYVNIAKGSNGDFFVEYSDDPDFLEVTNVDINCSLTETFTDVTSGTGVTAADQVVFVADGNLVHVIWQEGNGPGTANDGLQYQNFDLSTSAWSSEGDIDIANFSTSFGATRASDGDIWVHTVDGTGATALWRCAATCGGTWSEQTAPFSSETNLLYATITYASTENDLVVSAIMDASEQAYFKTTDETTISYSDKFSYGFTAGDLGHIASMKQVTNLADAGVVLRQGANFEFATVPERSLYLLATTPFLGYLFKRFQKKKK